MRNIAFLAFLTMGLFSFGSPQALNDGDTSTMGMATVNLRTGDTFVTSGSLAPNYIFNSTIFPYSPWKDVPSFQLYLIMYDDARGEQVQQYIRRERGTIVSYFPVNVLMAFASSNVPVTLAMEYKALWARYTATEKVAPEISFLNVPYNNGDGAALNSEASTELFNSIINKNVSENVVQYGLLVEMVPDVTIAMMRYAATRWPAVLVADVNIKNTSLEPCWPSISAPGSGVTLTVYACKQDLPKVIQWFANLSVTRVVYPMLRNRNMNLGASELIQTGSIDEDLYDKISDSTWYGAYQFEMSKDKWPYWSAGLQGQGEIVGVGDMGVDVEQCYFRDPAYEGVYAIQLANVTNLGTIGAMSYSRISNHRKVVQYAFQPGAGDAVDGFISHGTMCGSSIAGAPFSNSSDRDSPIMLTLATGTAPYARLSVVDFSVGYEATQLYVPLNLTVDYFPVHAAVNATIISDSWGSLLGGYNARAQEFDKFLWRNPDFISLVAVGNYGNYPLSSQNRLATPAIAKNVVAVGAGFRIPTSAGLNVGVYNINYIRFGITFSRTLLIMELGNLPLLASVIPNKSQVEVAVADPITACTPLNNAAQVHYNNGFVR